MFCVFTYIAPILEQVTHLSPGAVTRVLVVFGVGITLGNLLGGRLADWKQMPVLIGGIVLLIVIFLAMPFLEPEVMPAVVMVFVWGCVHFAAGSPLQARIVDQAKGAPNLASTLNQGAFNLGNALGASLGGIMLTAGDRLPLSLPGAARRLPAWRCWLRWSRCAWSATRTTRGEKADGVRLTACTRRPPTVHLAA